MSKYIIRLNDAISESDYNDAIKQFESHGGEVSHHHTLFKGFTGSIPTDKATTLDSLPHVAAIEKDQEVRVQSSA